MYQEAIGKNKVHIGHVTALTCDLGEADLAEAVATQSLCDIQLVSDGTAPETYSIIQKEFASISAPDWEKRRSEASCFPKRLSMYQFGLDAGPDNTGAARRIKHKLRTVANVIVHVTWCFMHQLQLICKTILAVLDAFRWKDVFFPCNYFASVATVANVWRGPGVAASLRSACARQTQSESVARQAFGKMPGRCLRGRWASIDSVEVLIIAAMRYLGPCLAEALAGKLSKESKVLSAKMAASANAVGLDDDQKYQAEQKAYRANAITRTSSCLWRAMVVISNVAKSVLVQCLYWMQKQQGQHDNNLRAAVCAGRNYMGPTPLSNFVTYKAAELFNGLCSLASPEAMQDPGRWGPVWDILPPERYPEALCLILSLVLRGVASWKHRLMARVSSLPLRLLVLAEADPGDEVKRCSLMQQISFIAKLLLDMED